MPDKIGKESLQGLIGLPGLNMQDAEAWYDRNAEKIQSIENITSNDIQALYLNKLIKDRYGEATLDSIKVNEHTLEGRKKFWSDNWKDPDDGSDDTFNFDDESQSSYAQTNSDEQSTSDKQRTSNTKDVELTLREKYNNSTNKSNSEDQLTESDYARLIDDSFGKYIEDSYKNNNQYQKELVFYSNKLQDTFAKNPELALKYFNQFEAEAKEKSKYYRNYIDSPVLQLSVEENNKIMADYFAIKELTNDEEATKYLQKSYQDIVDVQQGRGLNRIKMLPNAMASNAVGMVGMLYGLTKSWKGALIKAIAKDTDLENANFFQEFMYYSFQDPVVKWAADLTTTGAWSPKVQEEYKAREYNRNEFVRDYDSDNGTLWDKVLDESTVYDIIAQMGFSYGGMGTSIIGNAITKGTTKGFAKLGAKAAAKEAALLAAEVGTKTAAEAAVKTAEKQLSLKSVQFASKAIAYADKFTNLAIPTLLPAYSEAALEAYNLGESLDKSLENDVRQYLFDNYFNDFYYSNRTTPLTLPSSEGPNEEELKRQREENDRISKAWEDKVQEILNSPDVVDYIESTKARAIAKSTYKNTLWIATGDALLSRMLSPAVIEARHALLRTDKLASRFVINSAGEVSAIRNLGFNIAKASKDAVWEGVEEVGQEVINNVWTDLSTNNVINYINNVYNGEGTKDLADGYWENYKTTLNAIGKTATDKETYYSFFLGALSAGGGMINGAGVQRVQKEKAEGKYDTSTTKGKLNYLAHLVGSLYYNPIIEAVRESNSDYEEAVQEAKEMNEWLAIPENKALITDENAIINFANSLRNISETNDERTFRDTQLAQSIKVLSTFSKIKGTSIYNQVRDNIDRLININSDTNYKEKILKLARHNFDEVDFGTSTEEERDAKIIERISKNASNMKALWAQVEEENKKVEADFGNGIDSITKEAIVYGKIAHSDWVERKGQLNDEISQTILGRKHTSTTNSEVANAVARIGTVENGKREIKKLKESLKSSRVLKREGFISKFFHEEKKNTIKERIKQLERDVRLLSTTAPENLNLSVSDIIGLNEAERYQVLYGEDIGYNASTREAKQEILNHLEAGESFKQKVGDAAVLQSNITRHNRMLSSLRSYRQGAVLLGMQLKTDAAIKNLSERTKDFKDESDYDTFVRKLEGFLSNNDLSEFEKAQLGTVFKNNKNYAKYKGVIRERMQHLGIASRTSSAIKTPKKYMNIANAITVKIISEGLERSLNTITELLNDDSIYEDSELKREDLTDEDIIAIKNNCTARLKELDNYLEQKLKEEREKIKPVATPAAPQPAPVINNNPVEEKPKENPKPSEEKPIDPNVIKPNYTELGSFKVSSIDEIQDENEKEYYEKQGIRSNITALQRLFNKKGGLLNQKFVLLADKELESTYTTELNEDNYPLAVAIVIDEENKSYFDDSFIRTIDGVKVAIVGLIKNSSEHSEGDNSLTVHRSNAKSLATTESFLLKELGKDKPIMLKGATFNRNGSKVEGSIIASNTSIIDFLIDKITKKRQEEDTKESSNDSDIFSEAFEDFYSHTFKISRLKVEDDETLDPSDKIQYTYQDKNGETHAIDLNPEDAKYGTQLAYIDEEGNYLILTTDNTFSFDENTSIYDVLNRENPYAAVKENPNKLLLFKNAINRFKSVLISNKNGNLDKITKTEDNDLSAIEKELNAAIQHEFNIAYTFDNKEPKFNIRLERSTIGESKAITFYLENTIDGKKRVAELGTIPVSEFKEVPVVHKLSMLRNTARKETTVTDAFANGVLEIMKNVIFDENGNVRIYNNSSLVKPQINYTDMLNPEQKEYARGRFFSGVIQIMGTASSSRTDLVVNNTVNGDTTTNFNKKETKILSVREKVAAAMNALLDYMRDLPNRVEYANKEAYEAVTRWISKEEDKKALDSSNSSEGAEVKSKKPLEAHFEFGNSIDSLLRLWFSNSVQQDRKNLITFLNKNKIYRWVGFTKGNVRDDQLGGTLKTFVDQMEGLSKRLKDRGEIPVPFEVQQQFQMLVELKLGNKAKKLAAIPDLITIDQQGQYHIYDFKTFSSKGKEPFTLEDLLSPGNKRMKVEGMSQEDRNRLETYYKQLNLYRYCLQEIFGENSVSPELGIILIGLNYDIEGKNLIFSDNKLDIVGAHNIQVKNGDAVQDVNFKEAKLYQNIAKVPIIPLERVVDEAKWNTVEEEKPSLLPKEEKKAEETKAPIIETVKHQVAEKSKPSGNTGSNSPKIFNMGGKGKPKAGRLQMSRDLHIDEEDKIIKGCSEK